MRLSPEVHRKLKEMASHSGLTQGDIVGAALKLYGQQPTTNGTAPATNGTTNDTLLRVIDSLLQTIAARHGGEK